ncbi:hypothetical protein ACGFMM_25020 [Streptomyces sp. NPDC048604]
MIGYVTWDEVRGPGNRSVLAPLPADVPVFPNTATAITIPTAIAV